MKLRILALISFVSFVRLQFICFMKHLADCNIYRCIFDTCHWGEPSQEHSTHLYVSTRWWKLCESQGIKFRLGENFYLLLLFFVSLLFCNTCKVCTSPILFHLSRPFSRTSIHILAVITVQVTYNEKDAKCCHLGRFPYLRWTLSTHQTLEVFILVLSNSRQIWRWCLK
jgi:hypothetical protein